MWWLPDNVTTLDSTRMAQLKEESLIRLRPQDPEVRSILSLKPSPFLSYPSQTNALSLL